MAKSKDAKKAGQASGASFIHVDTKALDPALASLFASSSGPVQAPPKSRYQDRIVSRNDEELSELEDASEDAEDSSASDAGSDAAEEEDDEELSELDSDDASSDDSDDASSDDSDDAEQSEAENEAALAHIKEAALNGTHDKPTKKRKRGDKEEVEEAYLRKLAREEEKEEEARQKKRKTDRAASKTKQPGDDQDDDDDSSSAESSDDKEDATFEIPQHESLAQSTTTNTAELEKAARTVFLSNVSTTCINSKSAEKALKKHLESFIPDLADHTPPHKLESLRYRSTAFDNSLPKRAAFAKKEIMDATTRSTNAYAVYNTKVAAREAVKHLNGSVLLNRHLHVDSVAHPTKTEHRRCVFVGNLPFVDDISAAPTPEGEAKKKPKATSDVEEGLWTHFAKAGKIESVRVVRDAATRVGKGFAYVQFYDENAVEAALQFDEKKFPPMLPRKLRVTRCKAEKKGKKDKARVAPPTTSDRRPNGKAGYVAKLSEEQKSMQGRARSMLGKVAKAQSKEGFVFEGHRARESQGKSGIKFKGSGGAKKKGVNGRKSRSAAWKKGGNK